VSGIIGCLYTGCGFGTLVGPWLAGVAYDALGSYHLPIAAGALFSFAAAICVLPLRASLVNAKSQAVHSG
jgi:cyanate permease